MWHFTPLSCKWLLSVAKVREWVKYLENLYFFKLVVFKTLFAKQNHRSWTRSLSYTRLLWFSNKTTPAKLLSKLFSNFQKCYNKNSDKRFLKQFKIIHCIIHNAGFVVLQFSKCVKFSLIYAWKNYSYNSDKIPLILYNK